MMTSSNLSQQIPVNIIEKLQNEFSTDIKSIQKLILENIFSQVDQIPETSKYIFDAGGKRIRPLLTLSAAKLFDYSGSHHIYLATAVEFIHTATLLHDDVIDESELRRGRKTAHMLWGNKSTILVGDFLFSKAFELMVETKSINVLKTLSHASTIIAEGEIFQLDISKNIDLNLENYYKVIQGKTAELFAAASKSGAQLANQPEEICQLMYQYGLNLGMAFQIIDDILDYQSDKKDIGKHIGDDFFEGKLTLPVILSLSAAKDEELNFWKRAFVDKQIEKDDLPIALDYLEKSNSFKQSELIAQNYVRKACQALENLSSCNPLKEDLIELAKFSLSRAS